MQRSVERMFLIGIAAVLAHFVLDRYLKALGLIGESEG